MFTKPNKGKGEKRQRFTLIEEASGQAPTPPPRKYLSYLPKKSSQKARWWWACDIVTLASLHKEVVLKLPRAVVMLLGWSGQTVAALYLHRLLHSHFIISKHLPPAGLLCFSHIIKVAGYCYLHYNNKQIGGKSVKTHHHYNGNTFCGSRP